MERHTLDESDLLSDDEVRRRRGFTLPKQVHQPSSKAASLTKLQQQQQQQQRQHTFAKQTEQHMKESLLKDLRITLSESNAQSSPGSRSLAKPQRQSHPLTPKRVTSIPKLSVSKKNCNDSNNNHASSHRKKKSKKRKLPGNANQWTSVSVPTAWGEKDSGDDDDDDDDDDDARQINAGVYLLENTKTGHCYFGTTWDLKNAAAQNFFDLENGMHPHQALTKCFQLYGADASGIRYRVLERVAAPPIAAALAPMNSSNHSQRPQALSRKQRHEQTDDFDVRKMELLLQRRLHFHMKKRVRKRTLRLVRRLVLLPYLKQYWPRWTQFAQQQRTSEHHAAAVELQRMFRGHLGKQRALQRRQLRAATQLQRFMQVCVATSILRRRRRAELENSSARTIQKCVRGCVERRKLRNRQLMVTKWLQARKIQACYRGHRGRRVALQMTQQRVRSGACTVIQRVARGCLARKDAQQRRAFALRTRAAVCIQKRWRGVHARAAFSERNARTSEYQRRNAAATKIQTVYWRFLERKLRHVASQYTLQVQQATAIRMAYKNYVAKKFGWAAMTFALETSMAVRIQRGARRWRFLHRIRQLVSEERRDQAARSIQRIARGKLGRQRYLAAQLLQRQGLAARRIQAAWRSHRFLEKLASVLVQWRRAKSACLIQSKYRCHHARQAYICIRTHARRERAAIALQCMYRSRNARREWRRRLLLREHGACGDCGEELATLYSFSVEMELCISCWSRYQEDSPHDGHLPSTRLETLDVQTYRRLKTQVVCVQRAYRRYRNRLTSKYGVCPFCEHNAIRKHCEACGSKRFCHSCAAIFHQLKKGTKDGPHDPIAIEAFETRERAATLIQKHFRRFRHRRTLSQLRQGIENVAAQRIQRVYWTHRQRRTTRALCAVHALQLQNEQRCALTIQRCYRGHCARKARHQLRKERESAICIQKIARGRRSRLVVQGRRQRRSAAIVIQRHVRGVCARRLASLRRQERWQRKRDHAATCIQRHARGLLVRQRVLGNKKNAAALTIQLAWRRCMARQELQRRSRLRDARRREEEDAIRREKAVQKAEADRHAATRIQTRWRQHSAAKELRTRRVARARQCRERRRDQCVALETASAVRIQQVARSKWIAIASKQRLSLHCRARQFRSRRVLQRLRREKHAVITIQRAFRYARAKRKLTSIIVDAGSVSPWVELFDESSGSVYYYNTETMESSWDKPAELEGEEDAANQDEVELEWVEYWDENVGASYFYNMKTGEATWTTPEGMDSQTYYGPPEWDGTTNQAPDHQWSGDHDGPDAGSVFRTLPPKTKASMDSSVTRSHVRDDNQLPEAMFQTAPSFPSSPSPLPPRNDGAEANDDQAAMAWEYDDDSAVDTEYDINYKIYMTQLERDRQQEQQQQQDESEDQEPSQQRQESDPNDRDK